MVSTESRPIFVSLIGTSFVIGHVCLATAGWYLQYWRTYVQTIYAPSFLFVFYIFLIDESPRWLLTKDRKPEAVEILKKIARTNKISLDNVELEKLTCEDLAETSVGYVNLLKSTFNSKIILKRFLVSLVWWTAGMFLNCGIAVNSVLLIGNKYLNFILIYLIDIPAMIGMVYLLTYFKRKMPLMLTFFGASVFFGVHPFLPDGNLAFSFLVRDIRLGFCKV